jgi:hypothetical protein
VSFARFNQLEIEMSDQDNLLEDEYERKLEASNESRDASIDFHRENWMMAVMVSPEKSHGTFPDVSEYVGKNFDLKRVYRPANSSDIFVDELNNNDFMARAAEILIKFKNGGSPRYELDELFDDMAESYADNQYEQSKE